MTFCVTEDTLGDDDHLPTRSFIVHHLPTASLETNM